MAEPLKEGPVDPLEFENTIQSPTSDHPYDHEKDTKQIEEDDQTGDPMAGPSSRGASGQDEAFKISQDDQKIFEHIVPETYDQVFPGSSEQTEGKASNQADNTGDGQVDQATSEETGQNVPSPVERRGSQKTDHKSSGQGERRISQQVDRRLSGQTERRISQQSDHRSSGQVENKTLESADFQLPSLTESRSSEQTDGVPSNRRGSEKAGHSSSIQAEKKSSENGNLFPVLSDQRISQQIEEQVDSYDPEFMANEDDEGQYQADLLVNEEIEQKDYRSYYKTLAQAEDRMIAYREDDKDHGYKVEPCKFEESQKDLKPKLSVQEYESATILQPYTPDDGQSPNNSQAKDHFSYEKLPSISTKVYYTSSREKAEDLEISPDDMLEVEQEKSSKKQSLTSRRKLPPLVYQDPYQVALQYMEHHNILQIFQITENLVYEQPQDPLDFMLGQVQEMMRKRDEM